MFLFSALCKHLVEDTQQSRQFVINYFYFFCPLVSPMIQYTWGKGNSRTFQYSFTILTHFCISQLLQCRKCSIPTPIWITSKPGQVQSWGRMSHWSAIVSWRRKMNYFCVFSDTYSTVWSLFLSVKTVLPEKWVFWLLLNFQMTLLRSSSHIIHSFKAYNTVGFFLLCLMSRVASTAVFHAPNSIFIVYFINLSLVITKFLSVCINPPVLDLYKYRRNIWSLVTCFFHLA